MNKEFDTAVIASVTYGILLDDTTLRDCQDLCTFLTGQEDWHPLAMLSECGPLLRDQFPWLKRYNFHGHSLDDYRTFNRMKTLHGQQQTVLTTLVEPDVSSWIIDQCSN